MIPLWFLPYAIACGNCFILKPSERVPLTSQKIFELLDRSACRRASSAWSMARRAAVDALLDHPACAPFRSSARRPSRSTSTSARPRPASASSARAAPRTRSSCMPDADVDMTPEADRSIRRSAAPASAAWPLRSRCRSAKRAADVHPEAARRRRRSRRVGFGLDPGCRNGPGDHAAEPAAHRRPRAARRGRGRHACWWTAAAADRRL